MNLVYGVVEEHIHAFGLIRMPDGIATYHINGVDYIVTANEGDSREWGEYLNEDERNFGKGETSPTGKITAENSGLTGKVVFFDSSDYDGLDSEFDYLFGGRSFTVFKADEQGLTEIYTSGNEFEAKTAGYELEHFNCSNDNNDIDDRSGKKGVEAENVTIGNVGEKIYAFIGLERIGGVMMYDVTNPEKISYANYITPAISVRILQEMIHRKDFVLYRSRKCGWKCTFINGM